MKHILLIASLLLIRPPLAMGAPECILSINEVPPKGATQVWSPLFQASWEKLNAIQGGKLEKVIPPNALIKELEEFEWKAEAVLPADGYAVYAGPATREFARETVASIKEKFKIDIEGNPLPPIAQGKAAYGILLRDLKFKKKFFRSQKQALEFKARTGKVHKVEFFGTTGNHSNGYGNFVKVLHHDPKSSSFTLSVATDAEGENLIIFCPSQECSFRVAMEHVKKALKNPLSGPYGSLKDGSLHQKDVVKIPYVTIDAESDFTKQLSGSLHYAGEPLPSHIVRALQTTKFELFEEGARVRVDVELGSDPFGAPRKPPQITPRSFVCDRPFYVFLWKKRANWPYLAAWIDGNDSLTPFPK